ncbi:MAG: hypothetical protein M1376_00720, partial [Planctomycetes bacterium]|nr:hypothetical protein [Planctomycetota bacterium]
PDASPKACGLEAATHTVSRAETEEILWHSGDFYVMRERFIARARIPLVFCVFVYVCHSKRYPFEP